MCFKFGLFISCSLTELAVLEARENLIKYLPVWVSKGLNTFKNNHLDQDASKERTNPLQARVHSWFLWSTMIWVIMDHSVQRKLYSIARGLVDFVIRLVNSVLNLQVQCAVEGFRETLNYSSTVHKTISLNF